MKSKKISKTLRFTGLLLVMAAQLAFGESLLSVNFATDGNFSINDLQSKLKLTVHNFRGNPEQATSHKFLRLGGDLDATTSLQFPLGGKNTKGSVKVVLGTSTSYANAEVRLMSDTSELFKCVVNPKNLTVNSSTETQYPGDFVTVDREIKENRVAVSFSWDVPRNDVRGKIAYALTQPDKSGEGALKVKAEEQSLKANGFPDTLIIEPTRHDHVSRVVELYELNVTKE